MAAKTSCVNTLFVLLVILHTQCTFISRLFNDNCVGVWIKWAGFEFWLGSLRCVLGKDILLS